MGSLELIQKYFTWHNKWETGVTLLDDSHVHLFRLLKNIGVNLQNHNPLLSLADNNSHLIFSFSEFLGAMDLHFHNERQFLTNKNSTNNILEEHYLRHQSLVDKFRNYQLELSKNQILPSTTIFLMLAKEFIKHLEYDANQMTESLILPQDSLFKIQKL